MKIFNWSLIIIFILVSTLLAKSKPDFVAVNNSYGYQSILLLNDTLRIDTTGAGAYKKVVTDTSNAIEVNRIERVVYSWRSWSNGDSIIYQESIACYDDGLNQWTYPTEYTESGTVDSIFAITGTTSEYGRRLLSVEYCDKIKFIMAIPATAGHSDTIYIPSRYLRLSE